MSVFEDVMDEMLAHNFNDAATEDNISDKDNNEPNDGKVKVEPKKRAVRNPKQRLTLDTLTGPRGIHTIENYFKGIKFRGKHQEDKDLAEILSRLQHWAHRMYPNYKFDDVLTNIERLSKKKQLQHHMVRYRQGQLEQEVSIAPADDEDRLEVAEQHDEPFDEFDALLSEQIAISKINSRTPNHNITFEDNEPLQMPNIVPSETQSPNHSVNFAELESSKSEMLAASPGNIPNKLTAEQMAQIAEKRRIAKEKLRAKKEAMLQN